MPDRVDRLREAAQARHDATLRRATNALQRLARRGEPVTFRRLAETAGRQRQAANHRTVLINLDKIITSLQSLRTERGEDG